MENSCRSSSPGLWLLGLAAMGAFPAEAAPLPSPSTSVFCSVEGNSFLHPTQCQFGGGPGIPSSASAEVTLDPIPHVLAIATTPRAGVLGAGSSATALYYFQVNGPTEGELVPLLMDIYLDTTSTLSSNAIARLLVSTTSGTFEGFEVCSDGTCEETNMSETISVQVRTGSTRDSVTLYAQAQAFVTGFSDETATAIADPYFYIDPSFPNAHLYSVIVSPGVGNEPASPVPEPATVCLIGAALGWLQWRRRPARLGRSKPAV